MKLMVLEMLVWKLLIRIAEQLPNNCREIEQREVRLGHGKSEEWGQQASQDRREMMPRF